MKLYFSKGACSLAVRIIINELQLPCDFVAVNIKTKQTESGENYLEINPKGAVPVIELDNGERLTENAVILQYLADTHHATQLLPPLVDFDRYRILEWLNYVSTELHKTIGIFFNRTISDEIKQTIFAPLIKKKLDYLEKHFSEQDFLYDQHFTLPDAYLFVMLTWLRGLKFDLEPALSRYFDLLAKRPSVQLSLEQEG